MSKGRALSYLTGMVSPFSEGTFLSEGAHLEECATLDVGVVSMIPTLGVDIT